MYLVGLDGEEVHVKVREIHFRYQIGVTRELPNSAKPLHLEVLVPYVTAGLAEVYKAPTSRQYSPWVLGRRLTKDRQRSAVVARSAKKTHHALRTHVPFG